MLKLTLVASAFLLSQLSFADCIRITDESGRLGDKCINQEMTNLVNEVAPEETESSVYILKWRDGEVSYMIHTEAYASGLVKASLRARANYKANANKICKEIVGSKKAVINYTDLGNTKYQHNMQCQRGGGCSTTNLVSFSCRN